MPTTRNFSELAAELDARPDGGERRGQAGERLQRELVDYDASLAEMRRARRLTQVQLARALGISQSEVSRIEHQADLLLSTLRSYVVAMGGELEVLARFAETGESVLLDLGALAGADADDTPSTPVATGGGS